jgi:hypothetical protein
MPTILRRRNRLVLILVVATALLAPMVAAQAQPPQPSGGSGQHASTAGAAHQPDPKPPKKPKPPHPGPKPPPVGAPPSPVDISASVPRTMRDDLTGDFLGRNYDQRMRVEFTKLNIYDSPSRSGKLLQSTTTDLRAAPDGINYVPDGDTFPKSVNTWAANFQGHFGAYHINTLYLARNSQHLFITGTKGNVIEDHAATGPLLYQNYLYVVPLNGSCATAKCAKVVRLPYKYNPSGLLGDVQRAIGVTSLAAGYVGTRPYLAVGLSDGGVQIYDVSGTPRLTSTFTGMATGDGSQTPPTALAWDPAGSGLLAIGVIESGSVGYFVNVDANGNVQPGNRVWTATGGGGLDPTPLSAAIASGPDGKPVVAFGMSDQTLKLLDPAVTGATPLSSGTSLNTIVAINPIPRIDGTSGLPDYAVGMQSSPSDPTVGGGMLMRWEGTSSPLKPLPVTIDSSGSSSTVLPDYNSFRAWYPGLKEGRFRILNNSGEPISVTMHTRPQAGYGCWYAPAWADVPAFPSQPLSVAAGQTSANYPMGAYTAGSTGGCGASDPSGEWRGYLAITPVRHPADVRVVNLHLNRDMSGDNGVDVSDQAGGSTTVSITHVHPPNQPQVELGAAFGLWTITVDTPAAPTPQAAPSVTAYRLTTTVPGRADVYRFDVAPTTWSVPGAGAATPQIEAVIPPLDVQASLDGVTWTSVGSFLPPGALSSAPGAVTIGGGSFFWENPPNAPKYQYIRVLAGTLPSTAASLADLPAPTPETVTQITVTKGLNGNPATPEPNGLDQAALAVQLKNGSAVLPGSDPAYGSVYYLDENNNLITNLYQPGNYDSFLGIQPKPGAYPNTGISAQAALPPGSPAGYLSTTSTNLHTVQGFVGISNVKPSQPLNVAASALNIQVAPSQGGGYSLTGCADFANSTTCQLATPPALYQAGSASTGPLIGVLLVATGQNSAADLPLQWSTKLGAQKLATAALTIQGNNISIGNPTDYLPNDHLDITLVSHGQLVPGTAQIPGG